MYLKMLVYGVRLRSLLCIFYYLLCIMNIKQYIARYKEREALRKGKGYYETLDLGYQCVAWVKKRSKDVLGITLGSFWGNAITGRKNSRNIFKTELRDRIEYNGKNFPTDWSAVFYKADNTNGKNWHCAIFVSKVDSNNIQVIEQNGGGAWNRHELDKFTIRTRSMSNVVWRYTPKFTKSEYRRTKEERKLINQISRESRKLILKGTDNIELRKELIKISERYIILSYSKE